ncbi:MAG: GTPase HflX [Planctomycetota bacterium]
MAKHSFDLPLLHGEKEESSVPAVVLKAILPDEPSEQTPGMDPLAEIRSLADTAGLRVVGSVTQRRRRLHAATYVGKGKLEELQEEITRAGARIVVVDDSLSPSQGRNIEERVGTRVIDRVELIMDIFALRAKTHEAKLQVELAQLRYSASRLTRMWTHLSRFEGGIGMRGPGETQLETDRRIIRTKIELLKEKLEEIEQQRHTQHKGRGEAFRVALVGYTNAGKSTLMRRLTGADVLVENRLFSTLDTSTRQWSLPVACDVLLSDTVGFIRKLPASLVASFHATLLETVEADLLLHVVDGSSPQIEVELDAVQQTLERLEVADKPRLLLFNKLDVLPDDRRIDLLNVRDHYPDSLAISATTGLNLDGTGGLIERVTAIIQGGEKVHAYSLPHSRGDLIAQLRKLGRLEEETYGDAAVTVRARLREPERERFESLLAREGLL